MTKEKRADHVLRPLKVVHLCTTDGGGAGKAAYRLHKGLQAIGVDSTMLVVSRKNDDPSVRTVPVDATGSTYCPEEYPPSRLSQNRVWQHWCNAVARYPNRYPNMEIFSDHYSEIPLCCSREIAEADIVNLHWVAGMLDYTRLPEVLRGKKVVWTMHDMNPATGGCHYSGTCTRYRQSCGSCPMLGSSDDHDVSAATWRTKMDAYRQLDLHPVTPSRWLGQVASESSLLSPFETRVIPYGFPSVFAPFPSRDEVRRGYDVPEGAKVVMFGAEDLLNERKGFAYLLQALRGMKSEGVVLAFFGKLPEEVRVGLDLPLINLGFVEDEGTLAALYSMADLFVIPSLEDNHPNTVVEAMLCGVPVVGFDIGGIPDMVQHKETGYLVPPRDVDGLVAGIEWCLFAPEAAGMGARARQRAATNYSLERQGHDYEALYRELLSRPPLALPEREGGRGSQVAEARPEHAPHPALGHPLSPSEGNGTRLAAPPRISLVIPSYNYGRYLEACLDSILSQGYPNLDLIVLDAGSTDNTVEIIRRYERHIAFWRSEPDAGQYSAIEEGLNRSTGEIMAWLNADDMFHPGAFGTVSRIFSRFPEVEWLMGRPNCFDETGGQKQVVSYLPMNSRAKYLADQEFIQQEGVFWRRALWERSGAYIEKGLPLAADLELWARFFRSARLFSVDTLIAGFRDHPLQKSKDKAGYTAEANRVLAREREMFAAQKKPYNPPAPLPIILQGDEVIL